MKPTARIGLLTIIVVGLPDAAWAEGAILDCARARHDERTCMACNIYHEARGESVLGQRAVAMVVRNRSRSGLYPVDVCSVVWDMRRDARTGRTVAQFSWTKDERPDTVTDARAWLQATVVADAVLRTEGEAVDPTGGALNYHSLSVDPYWRGGLQFIRQIGGHLFYRPPSAGVGKSNVGATSPVRLWRAAAPSGSAEAAERVGARRRLVRIVRAGAAERTTVWREKP